MQEVILFVLNASYFQKVLLMNRRTFITRTIGLSLIGITGCVSINAKDKSKNRLIKKINTNGEPGWNSGYVRVTVIFHQKELGNLRLTAYNDGEVMDTEEIYVGNEKIVSYRFDEYYTDIDVFFTKV